MRSRPWFGLGAPLLPHLTVRGAQADGSRWLITSLATALIAPVLALVGPTGQKHLSPVLLRR